MMIETNFHARRGDRINAGASVATETVFVTAARGDVTFRLFLPVEEARGLIEKLQAGIAECEDYASVKAKRAEAA